MKRWRIFNRRVGCLVLAWGSLAVTAQTVTDSLFLSVDDLFERGVRHSLTLKVDSLQQQIAEQEHLTARAAWLPDVQVGLNAGVLGQPVVWEHGLSDPTRPPTPDWQQNYAVDFTQPIYQGGRIRYTVRKARMQHELAGLQIRNDEQDLKLRMLEQYLDLFSLFKQHQVLRKIIAEAERRLEDILSMKREGLITSNDVLRSRMQLTNDRLSLTQVENSIALVSQRLDLVLELDDHTVLIPDTTLLGSRTFLADYETFLKQAEEANPAMRMWRKKISLAQNDEKLAKATFRPQISLYAANTLARPISRTMVDMYNNSWNVGLSVSYPLSALYKNKNQLRATRLSVMQMRYHCSDQMQQLRAQIRTAYLRHEEALKQVDALRLSVRQAEENFRIMQNRYMSQLAILTDLLDADNVRLNAELQLITARTKVIYTYYQLLQATAEI